MRPSMLTGLFLLLVSFAPAAWPQSSGLCHFAEVPGPIVLPDNSFEEAGRLEVCLSHMYSPVAGVHRTSVNGRVAGMYVSHKVTETAALDNDRPYFVFARLADGAYKVGLVRLVRRADEDHVRDAPVSVRSRWRVRRTKVDSSDGAEPGNTKTYLIASVAAGR